MELGHEGTKALSIHKESKEIQSAALHQLLKQSHLVLKNASDILRPALYLIGFKANKVFVHGLLK